MLPTNRPMALGRTESLTLGCLSWKMARSFGNRYVRSVSGALTVRDPVTSPAPAPASTTASRASPARTSNSREYASITDPASVSEILLPNRSNNRTPSSRSSAATCALTLDCT